MARLNGLNLSPTDARAIRRITIVACGTSWDAGWWDAHIIEALSQIR